jgi:hypothetical protein
MLAPLRLLAPRTERMQSSGVLQGESKALEHAAVLKSLTSSSGGSTIELSVVVMVEARIQGDRQIPATRATS